MMTTQPSTDNNNLHNNINRIFLKIGFALWVTFSLWYTNWKGPLTPQEVDHYMDLLLQQSDGGFQHDPSVPAQMRQFLEQDTGNQFFMVNLMDENLDKVDQLQQYMNHVLPELLKRGGHPIFAGTTTTTAGGAISLIGIDDNKNLRNWTQFALVRYRSRRDMIDMATQPDFRNYHHFKVEGLIKTIAQPVEPILFLMDVRFLLGLIILAMSALLQLLLTATSKVQNMMTQMNGNHSINKKDL